MNMQTSNEVKAGNFNFFIITVKGQFTFSIVTPLQKEQMELAPY